MSLTIQNRGDVGGALSGVFKWVIIRWILFPEFVDAVRSLGKQMMNQNSGARERTVQSKTSPADVIMWSGCKDSQTVGLSLPPESLTLSEYHSPCSRAGRTADFFQSADTSEAGRATGAMSYVGCI